MIFKVTYQQSKATNPKREDTKSLYLEAESDVDARALVEKNTPYNIEFVQPLDPAHLAYEQKNPDFALTEFN